MAIVWTRAITGQGGRRDDKGGRQYTRVFKVLTDSVLDGAATVLLASGLPNIGDIYSDPNGFTDTGAWCVLIDPQQDGDNPLLWVVTCEFSSLQQNPDFNNDNPLLRPADIEVDFVRFQVPLLKATTLDEDFEPVPFSTFHPSGWSGVVNSAWDCFDPPIMADSSRPVIRITKNEEFFDFPTVSDFVDSVNSQPWLEFEIGECKIASIKGIRVHENNIFYWRKTYEVEVIRKLDGKMAGWDFEVLDQGYREYVSAAYRTIRDSNGIPVSSPALLDGNGVALANGAEPQYVRFRAYKRKDFNELNIP